MTATLGTLGSWAISPASKHPSIKCVSQSPASKGIPSGDLKKLRSRQLKESLHEALEEYRASKGTYPFTLDILAVRGFAPKKLIDRVYQSNLKYGTRNNGESYVIDKD